MLPPTHPCLSTFSGPSIPLFSQLPFRFLTPSVLTFFRPSQFRVLTTKPLFFLSFSSRFLLTDAFPVPALALAFLGFPFLSGLISHAFLPGFCTRLYCSFPFALPCFAPTAVPQVLTFFSAFSRPLPFRSFPLPFRFLSSARLPLPATQPSAHPFLFFPVLPCSCFPGAPPWLSPSSVSPFSPAWFPVPSFQVSVLSSTVGFLSPFPDSLPQLFLRCLPCAFAFGLSPSFPLSFVCFFSGSGYSASVSSFPLSSCPCLTVACPVLPLCLAASLLSPFFPAWFPVSSFPVLRTRLSVCFLSSLPVSLPQLLSRCFPYAFAFGLSPCFPLSFVRFCSVLTTQLSVFLFPSSRFPLSAVPPVLPLCLAASLLFLFRPACCHAFLPIAVLSFLQFLSPTLCRPTELLQRPGLPLRALAVPLCLSLQVWLLGFRFLPSGFLPVLSFVTA